MSDALIVLWEGKIDRREVRVIDIPSDGQGPSVQALRHIGLNDGRWERCYGRIADRAMRAYNKTKGSL